MSPVYGPRSLKFDRLTIVILRGAAVTDRRDRGLNLACDSEFCGVIIHTKFGVDQWIQCMVLHTGMLGIETANLTKFSD